MENGSTGSQLDKKEKTLIKLGALGIAVVSFKLGGAWDRYRINRGIQKLWDEDPTLKEHMWKVLADCLSKK